MATIEIWKDIPGYEGYYQVSSFGKVRSIDRWITYAPSARYKVIKKVFHKGQILKPALHESYGYYHLSFVKNNIPKDFNVHRLVAESFLDNPNQLPQVNHKDGKKLNNNVNNLEWISTSGNMLHAIDTGLRRNRCPLQTDDLLKVIEGHKSGISRRELATKFNVHYRVIKDIINGGIGSRITGIKKKKCLSK